MPSYRSKKILFKNILNILFKIFKKQRFVVLRVGYVYARNQKVFIRGFKKKILKIEDVCFIII